MLIYSRPRLTVKPVSIVRMSMFTRLLARHSVLPSVYLSACRTVHLVAPSLVRLSECPTVSPAVRLSTILSIFL